MNDRKEVKKEYEDEAKSESDILQKESPRETPAAIYNAPIDAMESPHARHITKTPPPPHATIPNTPIRKFQVLQRCCILGVAELLDAGRCAAPETRDVEEACIELGTPHRYSAEPRNHAGRVKKPGLEKTFVLIA